MFNLEFGYSKLFCILGIIAYILLLIILPKKIKNNLIPQAGKFLESVKAKDSKSFIAVLIAAPILLCLLFFRELGAVIDFVIFACSIIGVYMVFNEHLLKKASGIYENAIIADGKFVKYDDIEIFPTLEWEESYTNELKVIKKDGTEFSIFFADEQERAKGVKKILELCKRLAPKK